MDNLFSARISALYDLLDLTSIVRIADIGANPMRHDAPYRDLLKNKYCNVVGFEPQENTMKEVVRNKGANEEYFNFAVGDGKPALLNIYKGSGLTSLLKIRGKTLFYLRGLRNAARQIGSMEMQTQRLDDIAGLGPVDFLKIDIQGAELSVFTSAEDTLKNVAAIQTEVSFFPLYENQPGFGEVDTFLRKLGFLPHSFAHIENRLVISKWSGVLSDFESTQMLDGDIIYLRDLSDPAELNSQMLKRLAILTEGVFGFTDVSLKILDILAQRQEISEADVNEYIETFISP
ncbi:FkbM family methyltransferase [Ruegeria faecimaris]|uniref:Methyltransferase, FkbM family n=1 Tax=Ruegeria faecimaris TaxID=686389 RepID=A0A521C6A0_9RHOB|nr:FkbM family methyltransferase [Ruegeria faecimaris]SMO54923.1 methyltransferase, FkbM family [Ruegeria faecimaris]